MECKLVYNEFCMQSVIHTVPMDAIRKDPANANHVVRTPTRMTRTLNRALVCISLHCKPTLAVSDKMNGRDRQKSQVTMWTHQRRSRYWNEHSLLVFGSDRGSLQL